MNVITTRWFVSRRPFRELKFGEYQRDVMRWSVTPYIPVHTLRLSTTGRLLGSPTYFPTLALAVDYARREQARFYGLDRTPPSRPNRIRMESYP